MIVTLRYSGGTTPRVNEPVITLFASIVTANGLAMPLAAPLHPEKTYPFFGAALSTTRALFGYVSRFGAYETVPCPAPATPSV